MGVTVRSSNRPAWLALFLAVSLSPLGCGEHPCPAAPACDIREADCQNELLEVAQCHRGGPPASAAIRVVDAERHIAEQVAAAAGGNDGIDWQQLSAGLSLFHLLPADYSAAQATADRWDRIAAYFSSEENRITILDRGRPLDTPSMSLLLVHELLHALQESYPGFAPFHGAFGGTYDASLALRAYTEGEASFYEDLVKVESLGWRGEELDWEPAKSRFRTRSTARWHNSDAPFVMASIYFPYAHGLDYIEPLWQQGGNDAVLEGFKDPPRSTRQVLAGYGGAEPDGGPWTESVDNVAYPLQPPPLGTPQFLRGGAYLFEAFAYRAAAGVPYPTGSRLRGDLLTLHRDSSNGSVVVVWRQRWGNAEAAAEVVTFVNQTVARSDMTAWQIDRDAVILASTDPAWVVRLAGNITWGPLPPTKRDVATAKRSLPLWPLDGCFAPFAPTPAR